MDEKLVFIVHGRNISARDAMNAFVRTLGLRPIGWEEARSFTGKTAPTTLEIVTAGIRAAQCVVVLFTADDVARLLPIYGDEPSNCQPRPNVIFEAGLALSTASQERTIFVKSGAIREISDLTGINYIDIDNSMEKRWALKSRLQSAGCAIVTNDADFLKSNIAGDFDEAFKNPDGELTADSRVIDRTEQVASSENTIRRAKLTNVIVDASISHSINSMDLFRQIEDWLENGGIGNLRYNYLGTFGAQNWLDLSEDPVYGYSGIRDFVANTVPDFIAESRFNYDIDFVSLGPGDGSLDRRILRKIQALFRVRNYYPLDISIELLQRTSMSLLAVPALRSEIGVKAIHGDFFNLGHYKSVYSYDDYPNVISMLGFSFGNYNESELLAKLRDGMDDEDLLIFDARVHRESFADHEEISAVERDRIAQNYRHPSNNRFAFGALDIATTAEFSDVQFDYEVNTEMTVVPRALNIITVCKNLATRLKRNPARQIRHDALQLTSTTIYDQEALLNWINHKGFSVNSSRSDGKVLVVALRKR